MSEIEIFIQGEGIEDITLVRVPGNSTVRDIVDAIQVQGAQIGTADGYAVMLEDSEEVLELDQHLEAVGIGHRSRVHINRCRHVEVSVNYNGEQKERSFPAAATVRRVKLWSVREFGLKKVDATEHALQVCGSTNRPDEDVHIGSLVQYPSCALCFDLVPKQRVEG